MPFVLKWPAWVPIIALWILALLHPLLTGITDAGTGTTAALYCYNCSTDTAGTCPQMASFGCNHSSLELGPLAGHNIDAGIFVTTVIMVTLVLVISIALLVLACKWPALVAIPALWSLAH